jgi:hypothetical protein
LKRALLLTAFFALIIVEVALLEGFLPYEWQHAINQRSERAFSSQQYGPHANLDWEFELYFRQHPRQRNIQYAAFGILTLANACLIAKVWQAFKSSKSLGPTT